MTLITITKHILADKNSLVSNIQAAANPTQISEWMISKQHVVRALDDCLGGSLKK